MAASTFSAKDLLEFLEWASAKHVLKRNTVDSWRTASLRVLETLDSSEQEDLRVLDVESVLSRFENRAGKNYKPESLRVYRSRFTTALEQFFKWKSNPSAYRPDVRVKTGSSSLGSKRPKKSQGEPPKISLPTTTDANDSRHETVESWMLPIPLRAGTLVKVFGLPMNLSKSEARKICAVISALANEGGDE